MDTTIPQAFLNLFWDPGVFLFPEWNWPKRNATYRWLQGSLEINQQSWNAVWFAPNWNLGKKNTVGQTKVRDDKSCEDYISSLYIDLDKRHTEFENKTDKEYEKYVLSVINKHKLRVQYAVKTWDWWHLYMFIFPEFRYECGKMFRWNLKQILEWLASMFIWWDASSDSMSKLLRLPWSKYWKTPIAKDVDLYKVMQKEDWERYFKKVESADEVTLWPLMIWTKWLQDFVKNQVEPKIKWKKNQPILYSAMTAQINQLDISEVISRLEKYPRLSSTWESIIFKPEWDSISVIRNWVRIETDWYKINKKKNYVHNFSFDYHPINERPRGPVYTFLYYYFDNDMTKLWEFLKEEFNIDFTDGWKETFMKLPAENWIILFQDDGVYYHKTISLSWQTTDTLIKLFNEPFIIKWVLRTNLDVEKRGEFKNKIMYTIVSLIKRDEDDLLISYKEDRKQFNRAYWKTSSLMFLEWEKDLIHFFDAIDKAARTWAIREYSHIYLNWYYQEWYVIWDKVYYKEWDEKDMSEEPVIIDTQEVLTVNINEEKTVAEYWELLRGVFTDRECMLAYTTFIALLMWDKFRKPALDWDWQQIILPGIFMSGITKSGKSTMVNLLLNWFGLSWDCRKYSVKWTTLQPLKQSATDDFILHREEFTWEIWNDKETVVRDVLNKTRTARWLIDWSNTYFQYRSSLIIDWEQLPESESVVNRCVTIPFMLEDRIWTQQKLREFAWVWFRKDFIKKLYDIDTTKVKEDFFLAQDRCLNNWIQDRYSMIYAFLLCVNQWFHIYLETELISAIKENFEQFNTINNTINPFAKLISDMIDKRRVNATLSNTEEWWRKAIIPIPTDDFAKRQADIMGIVKRYWKRHIKIMWYNMVCTVWTEKDEDELWIELYNYIILYAGKMKNVRYLDLDNRNTF